MAEISKNSFIGRLQNRSAKIVFQRKATQWISKNFVLIDIPWKVQLLKHLELESLLNKIGRFIVQKQLEELTDSDNDISCMML